MSRPRTREIGTLLAPLGITAMAGPAPLAAHGGTMVGPEAVGGAWATDPWALLGIGVAAWLYALGVRRVWRRAGAGRGIPVWRFNCYVAGLLVLVVALVSPLDPLGTTLFSAHMAQHELLIAVAAPLLVLGMPLVAFTWALPRDARVAAGRIARLDAVRRGWRALSSPVSAWTLHAAALWTWHAPALYQATLDSDAVHAAQHLSFFATALLFWWAVLHPSRHRRLAPGLAVLYLFTTAVYGSALGALLTFSPVPWYPDYAIGVELWGLSLLEDQQLGGLIMWVPFGLIYTAAALAILGRWLGAPASREMPHAAVTSA